jgi:cytochrome c biogenesis protein
MDASQEIIQTAQPEISAKTAGQPILNRVLKFMSSVRFGVSLLIILTVLSMVGMLIMQQNVDGFDHYYANLKPAQKIVYGRLGLFDIYHAWYFNALILILALNIILASIERAPKTWKIIKNRKLTASRRWILAQKTTAVSEFPAENSAQAKEKAFSAMKSVGLKPKVTEKDGKIYLFGERGAWNRLGYLVIHFGLLMILAGGFLTNQFGVEGQMPLAPGETSSRMLKTEWNLDKIRQVPLEVPFSVTCLDIQQKLIDPKGSIIANNTLDWLTRIRITDQNGSREELVHMNNPIDHAGYRFFQASFINEGKARNATVLITPENGSAQEINLSRGGEAVLPNGATLKWENFVADFVVGKNGQIASQSGEYRNPALVMSLTNAGGETRRVFAFAEELPPDAPINQPIMGYRFRLANFEKVAAAHVLSINRDPGATPFYLGGTILMVALCGVFFFSHRRVWALVEEKSPGVYELVLGGNTNRHQAMFEDTLKKIGARTARPPNERSVV